MLVLGGSGLLGSTVVRWLVETGVHVVWTSRQPQEGLPGRNRCFFLEGPPAQQETVLRRLLAEVRPEYVVNCLRGREDDSAQLWGINAVFPHLLERVAACPSVHVSTNAVFRRASKAWSVKQPPCPETEYGFSKLFGEAAAPQVILRTTFVGVPLLPGHAAPSWAVRGDQPDCLWNGVSVLEAARAVWRAMEEGWAGVVHLASDPEPWPQVVRWLHRAARVLRFPVAVPEEEIRFTKADPLLLTPTVSSTVPLEQRVADYVEFERKGRNL